MRRFDSADWTASKICDSRGDAGADLRLATPIEKELKNRRRLNGGSFECRQDVGFTVNTWKQQHRRQSNRLYATIADNALGLT